MASKIISSTPDRRHPGIYRVTLDGGAERYRVTLPGFIDKRFPRTREGYEAAQDALQAAREAKAAGTRPVTARSAKTVAQVVAEWELELREDVALGRRAKGTATNYIGYAKYLVKIKGDVPMAKLTQADLQEIVTMGREHGIVRADGKPGRPWSSETHRLFKIVCDLVFEFALARRYAPTNISRTTMRAPKQSAHKRYESDHWTVSEMAMLDKLVTGDSMEIAFRLGLAGLRRGEVAGLKWDEHVFMDGQVPYLLIANTRVDNDGEVQEKGTKNGLTRRYPLADPVLVDALRREQKRQQRNRWKAGPLWQETGYVVVGPIGRPYTPDRITKAWKAFCINHELRYIKFHGSRHSFATHLANTGRTHHAQALLGHTSIRTTEIYVHDELDVLFAATQAAAQAVQAAGSKPRRVGSTTR